MPGIDSGSIQTWEVMVTTLAAAATPYLAYKFRERRLARPKNPTEALYQYYENYIDRLEKQIAKKDTIIFAQDQQIKEQQGVIANLQQELNQQQAVLDRRQSEINELKQEVGEMQSRSAEFHQKIDELKAQSPDIPGNGK